jgi:hypothetical protein
MVKRSGGIVIKVNSSHSQFPTKKSKKPQQQYRICGKIKNANKEERSRKEGRQEENKQRGIIKLFRQ